jgi:hypothetical protein
MVAAVGMRVTMRISVTMTVAMLVSVLADDLRLDRHSTQISVPDSRLRHHPVGEAADVPGVALQDRDLHAVLVIEMDVKGRAHEIMGRVL